MLLKKLLNTNIKLLVFYLISYFCSLFVNILLANHLPADSYGDINIILKIINMTMPVIMLGADATLIKYLPVFFDENKPSLAASYLVWVLRIMLIACTCIFIFLFCSGLIIYFIGYRPIIGNHHDIWLAAVLLPLFLFVNVFRRLLRCYGYYSFSVLSSQVLKYLIFSGFLLILFYLFETKNFRAVFLVILIGMFAVSIMQLVLLLPKLMPVIKAANQVAKPSKEWFKSALHFMISGFVFTAMISVDLMLLEILGHSEQEVGYFSAMLAINKIIFLVPNAFGVTSNAKATVLFEHKDWLGLQKIVSKAFLFNFFVGGFLVGLIILLRSFLLQFFGSAYEQLEFLLVIMLLGCWMICLTQNAALLLRYLDMQRQSVLFSLAGLVLAIILDVLLIPSFGMVGALISLIVVGVGINLAKVFSLKYKLQLKPFIIF